MPDREFLKYVGCGTISLCSPLQASCNLPRAHGGVLNQRAAGVSYRSPHAARSLLRGDFQAKEPKNGNQYRDQFCATIMSVPSGKGILRAQASANGSVCV
jgi:hypothetical protein